MDVIQAIKDRHSVRAFLDKPIDPGIIAQVKAEIERVNGESGLHIQFVENGNAVCGNAALKALGWKNTQFAIAMVGPKGDDLDERCGYWGEHLVLFCQSIGLNSCWAGMAKKRKVDAEVRPGEKYVIAIGFGYGKTQGKQHKSKPVEDLFSCDKRFGDSVKTADLPKWFTNGCAAALLAPTAMNQQQYTIHLNPDETASILPGMGFLVEVDLGIVKYHFEAGSGKDSSIWSERPFNPEISSLRKKVNPYMWA